MSVKDGYGKNMKKKLIKLTRMIIIITYLSKNK
jgi:hypothetical protein